MEVMFVRQSESQTDQHCSLNASLFDVPYGHPAGGPLHTYRRRVREAKNLLHAMESQWAAFIDP